MDALHAIFVAAASTPPGSRPPEPVVNIVVDQATFEAAMAAMAADAAFDDYMPPAGDPMSRRCETIDGDLVDPVDTVIAALIGQVRQCRVRLGVVHDRLGRRQPPVPRHFPPGGVATGWHPMSVARLRAPPLPGRPQPTMGANTDRTFPWNGGQACDHHNIWKTRGYHTWRDADGRWHVVRPDGTRSTRSSAMPHPAAASCDDRTPNRSRARSAVWFAPRRC